MLKPNEMAKRLNVTVGTLQRWDREGKLKAYRTQTNRRYYTEEQVNNFLNIETPENSKMNIAYSRVSSHQQKHELENQENFIKEFANGSGTIIDEYISDVASGLNYKRQGLLRLLELVMQRKVAKIFITYKDRLIRFGFELIEWICNQFNTEIVVLNDSQSSPKKEMVSDLISIIHVFSCRIYGLRKYKTKIKGDTDVSATDS